MIGIRVYDKLTAWANAWVHNCERVTKQELPAHIAEGNEILAAVRAECARIKSEKAAQEQKRDELNKVLLARKLEVQAIEKERDRQIRNCQLLASYVRRVGGYSVDDLVREIPKFHLAEMEKRKGRQLPEFARISIKSEVANGLRATLTRSIT